MDEAANLGKAVLRAEQKTHSNSKHEDFKCHERHNVEQRCNEMDRKQTAVSSSAWLLHCVKLREEIEYSVKQGKYPLIILSASDTLPGRLEIKV